MHNVSDLENFEILKRLIYLNPKLDQETIEGTKEISMLKEEIIQLREKLTEKANKLSTFYEAQDKINKSPKDELKESAEIEEFKKIVYESSAYSIYLENELKLIKARAPSLQELQNLITKNNLKTLPQKINDYLQNTVIEELNKIKNPIIENLRVSLVNTKKENIELQFELICLRLKASRVEKILHEEKKTERLLKTLYGNSFLDT